MVNVDAIASKMYQQAVIKFLTLERWCDCPPNPFHWYAPRSFFTDSVSPSLKSHRRFYLLVLEVRLPLKLYRVSSKTELKIMQKIEGDREGPRQLARRPFKLPVAGLFLRPQSFLIVESSGSSHSSPRFSSNSIGA
ncbi:hypothetical protein TNCV_1617371 [Trichonephila clavipes]|nr:hypothetical protein TNCV_1617371 [Trichonephila clavipes]